MCPVSGPCGGHAVRGVLGHVPKLMSAAKFSYFMYCFKYASVSSPVGPLRGLATMTSRMLYASHLEVAGFLSGGR